MQQKIRHFIHVQGRVVHELPLIRDDLHGGAGVVKSLQGQNIGRGIGYDLDLSHDKPPTVGLYLADLGDSSSLGQPRSHTLYHAFVDLSTFSDKN